MQVIQADMELVDPVDLQNFVKTVLRLARFKQSG